MLAATDLGLCRSRQVPEVLSLEAADMKANESFGLLLAFARASPLRGNQMLLTYFRKIVALTIVVVDRRMFVGQSGMSY